MLWAYEQLRVRLSFHKRLEGEGLLYCGFAYDKGSIRAV